MSAKKTLHQSFYRLTPSEVMDAVEGAGYNITGEYLQLNSYENRVFDIKLEKGAYSSLGQSLIVKFYRPGRWSQEAILEEHEFLNQLSSQGMPAVAPLTQKNGQTLSVHNSMYMAAFPKALGRMPQELNENEFKKIGRSLAQLHSCGEQQVAVHRPCLTVEDYGEKSLDILENWVSPEVWPRYEKAAENIIDVLSIKLNPQTHIRIHGDCHKGNLLLTDQPEKPSTFFFVDFDDFCMGPVAQDFWMLFSGSDTQSTELDWLLSGYEELRHFPKEQFELFEPLRGLRIIHYGAWIARRWQDPSFPQIFPQFESYSYWAEETETLEKIAWKL